MMIKNKILSILLGALLCASPLSAMQLNDLPEEITLTIMLFCDNSTLVHGLSMGNKEFREIYKKLMNGTYNGIVYPIRITMRNKRTVEKIFASKNSIGFIEKVQQPIETEIPQKIKFIEECFYKLMSIIGIIVEKIKPPSESQIIAFFPTPGFKKAKLEVKNSKKQNVSIICPYAKEKSRTFEETEETFNGMVAWIIKNSDIKDLTLKPLQHNSRKFVYKHRLVIEKLDVEEATLVINTLTKLTIDNFLLEPESFEHLPKKLDLLVIIRCVFVENFTQKFYDWQLAHEIEPYKRIKIKNLYLCNLDLDHPGDLSFLEELFDKVEYIGVKNCVFPENGTSEFFKNIPKTVKSVTIKEYKPVKKTTVFNGKELEKLKSGDK
jgi:hypothetical protein